MKIRLHGIAKNVELKGPIDSPILIYNCSTKRAEDFCAPLPGGETEVATSLSKAVPEVDILFTCVADDSTVDSVIDAMISTIKNTLVIDCSTIDPYKQ